MVKSIELLRYLGTAVVSAIAQTANTPQSNSQASAALTQGFTASDVAAREIVVVGPRARDSAIDSELGENAISASGANSIREVLSKFQDLLDQSGNAPLVLINGRAIGFDQSILDYPAAALSRVEILKSTASDQYSGNPGQRTVNLVLKPHFRSLEISAAINVATAGGQLGGALTAARNVISKDTRWRAEVSAAGQSALLKSSRSLPPTYTVISLANFPGLVDGGEGEPAKGAEGARRYEDSHFRTLTPSSHTSAASLSITRPVGSFSSTLNLRLLKNRLDGQSGLLAFPATLDATNLMKGPSISDLLELPLRFRPLRFSSRNRLLSSSLSVTGELRKAQFSLDLAIQHSINASFFQRGTEDATVSTVSHVNPENGNLLSPSGNTALQTSKSESHATDLALRVNGRRRILALPSGPSILSLIVSTSRAWNRERSYYQDKAPPPLKSGSSSLLSEQMTWIVPISHRGSEFSTLGDLTLSGAWGRQKVSRGSTQTNISVNGSWMPWNGVLLRGSLSRSAQAPSFQQLYQPKTVLTTELYDYTQRQSVSVLETVGGNADLGRGTSKNVLLSAGFHPVQDRFVTIAFDYSHVSSNNVPAPFPEPTPAVEQVLPGRFTRDAGGRLVAVDARPITVARQEGSEVSGSVAFRSGRKSTSSRTFGSAGFKEDPWQLAFSAKVRLRFANFTRIATEGTSIQGVGEKKVEPRMSLVSSISLGKKSFGADLGVSWNGSSKIPGDEHVRLLPETIVDLSMFYSIPEAQALAGQNRLLPGTQFSISVQNLLNSYRHAKLRDGSTPTGYSHDEVDPLGRVLRLTIKRMF